MQIIKSISNTDGQPTIFLPLIVIVIISMLKDIVEDYKRHKSDTEENNNLTSVFIDGKFEKIPWQNLLIGNIIKVLKFQ